MTEAFHIREASWRDNQAELQQIRDIVFIQEQHVPPELEWDEHDSSCIHLLALDHLNKPIGTGRMLNDGHIGRMAVLPEWRHRGVGSALLRQFLEIARQRNLSHVFLYAQITAIPFYQQHQFEIVSEVFMDAGIPHREMRRDIA